MHAADIDSQLCGTTCRGMIVAALAAMCLCACDVSETETPKTQGDLTSACEIAKGGSALDGQLVRFRSEFDLGVEYVRVVDSRCPRIHLFLRAANPAVDLTLCSEEGMRFGCPANPDLKVKVTFTGVFHASKFEGGVVEVTSITEISSDAAVSDTTNSESKSHGTGSPDETSPSSTAK